MLRLVYQRAKRLGNLPELTPRALEDREIVAGRAEFCVESSEDLDGGGWDGDLLVLPRQYTGYIAIHYPAATDQRQTFPDEARITAALATYMEDARAQAIPGLRQFGLVPARWFFNDRPVALQLPLVLTLSVEWSLAVDLLIPQAFLNPDATGGVTP